MSEQDNTLPLGWNAKSLQAAGGEAFTDPSMADYWEFKDSDLSALLRKAYEQGRREVEEAVGAGGVQGRTK